MKIEIFSDIICPWCFIGKQRLDRVLATEAGEGIELRWRPYLLYPNLPEDGVDRAERLRQRYGEDADPGRIPERIRMEAEGEALSLRFDLIQRTPNTLLAHRLMEFAYDADVTGELQHQLSERLFRAYFCEGQDVGQIETLLEQADQVGLSAEEARQYLESDSGMAEVQEQLERGPELGVSGVPGYYLAEGFLLPGAQTSETMGQIITRVKERVAAN